jgi:hypothetical protein
VIRIFSKSTWIVAALVAAVPAAVQAQIVSPFAAPVENRQAVAPSTAHVRPANAERFVSLASSSASESAVPAVPRE